MGERASDRQVKGKDILLICSRCKVEVAVNSATFIEMAKDYERKFGMSFSIETVITLCDDCKDKFFQ